MASRVRPMLSDNELIENFMGTLQGLYFEKMIGSSSSNFADIVTIGERIENKVKFEKIAGTVSQPTVNKKPQGSFSKRKEGETIVVMIDVHPQYQASIAPVSYYPYPYIIVTQYPQPPFQYQP